MIIRPRMPRIISRRSRIGGLGLRSLQRSVVHARRMLISRMPERSPEDLQSAMEQPLVWADYQASLPAPNEPMTLDAGGSSGTPFHRPNQQSQPASRSQSSSQNVQRQPQNIEASETMPRDLQAIFNQHKDAGKLDTGRSFMDNIRSEAIAKGKTPPRSSSRVQRSTTPEPPMPAPAQRQPVDDGFPIVVEALPPRRVRSRVEYIQPNEVGQPNVQKQSEPAEDSADDDLASMQAESVQRLPDEIIEEMPDDFRDEMTDTISGDFVNDDELYHSTDAQDAIARAEQPVSSTSASTPQISMSRAEAPAHSEYSDEPADIDNQSTSYQDDSIAEDVHQAIERAELPTSSTSTPTPQISLSRDEDTPPQISLDRAEAPADHNYDNNPVDIDSEPYQSETSYYADDSADDAQDAIARAEQPASYPEIQRDFDDELDDEAYFPTMLDLPDEPSSSTQPTIEDAKYFDAPSASAETFTANQPSNNVQRAIEDAERFDTPSEKPSIGQRPRKMTVSRSEPPMQIQPLRIDSPDASADVSFLDDADLPEDSYTDMDDNDNAVAANDDMTAENVQMVQDNYGEDSYHYEDEPPSLPEQSVDLGTALFGSTQQPSADFSPPIQRQGYDDIEATVMPPIGRTQHQVSRQSFTRQPEQSSSTPEAFMQRVSEDIDSDIYRAPSEEEVGLLSLLDMPTDTPIQQSSVSLPSVQASRDDSPSPLSIQREDLGTEASSDNAESEADSEDGEQSSEPNPEDVKKMANEVYQIIKRRLKVEQERIRGKK